MTLVEPNSVSGPTRTATGGGRGLGAPTLLSRLSRLSRLAQAILTEHVVVLGLLVALVLPLAHGGGGRDEGALAWLVCPLILALLVTRVWQRLDARLLALVAIVAVGALIVLVVTGGGRAGAVAATSYGFCLACGVVVASYARTPGRRAAVAGVICAGGIAQFAWALVPWWGGQDPSSAMVGTYFWHNQFAAALVAPALLGLALALTGRRPWRSAGWVAAPLSVAGVVLSTSRSTLALLVLGWLAVVVVALLGADSGRVRGSIARRALVCSVAAVGLTILLPGPPLFPTSASPLAGSSARALAGETVESNGIYRTEFWREAVVAFQTRPVAGVGYGRIADSSHTAVPSSWALSPLAHSGPLQALAEGGLVLALPLFVLLAAIGVALLLRLRGPTGREVTDGLAVRAAAVAALLLGVHACVDTDWSYPALAAQAAVVTGLALAVPRPSRTTDPRRGPAGSLLARVAVGALVVALVVGGALAWGQAFHIRAPISPAHVSASDFGALPTMSGGGLS